MSCKLWSLVCFFSIKSQWHLQINYLPYHLVHLFQFFFFKKLQLKSGHLGVHVNLCIHMHWRLSQMSILWYEPLTYEQGLEMNQEYIKVLSSKEGNRNLPKPPKGYSQQKQWLKCKRHYAKVVSLSFISITNTCFWFKVICIKVLDSPWWLDYWSICLFVMVWYSYTYVLPNVIVF